MKPYGSAAKPELQRRIAAYLEWDAMSPADFAQLLSVHLSSAKR